MRDRTAQIAHWMASGRTADLVAPAMRAATSPRGRETIAGARSAIDSARHVDPQAVRAAGERLARDPDLRKALLGAAAAVRVAIDDANRRQHRGRRWLGRITLISAGAAAAAVAVRMLRRDRPNTHHAHEESNVRTPEDAVLR
jgi:hypothetical protein